jgi:hypothetical protein
MANMIIQENGQERTTAAVHGEEITIQAPCNCSAVSGVQIAGVAYPFYDAAGKVLPSGSGLFAEGSLIRVLIDTVNTRATILNHGIRTHFATGSYIGTGAVGVAGTITLTFPFTPKFVAVMFQGEGSPFEKARAFFVYGSDTFTEMYNPEAGTRGHLRCTWGETSLSWYLAKICSNAFDEYEITDESDSLNDRYALNCTNREYHYIAIG